MSCAEFYKELAEKDQREISLRFGKEFEGRSPSNPVFGEFEEYISKAKNLSELVVNWDNTCAEVTLKALLNGINENRNKIEEIDVTDDDRPLHTIQKFDFVGLVSAIGRRTPEGKITAFSWGHNNYGASWWFTLKGSSGRILNMNEIVFPNARVYEATLADLLDQVAGDGVQDLRLYLDRFTKYFSYSGLQRIFAILSTKFSSLTSFSLKLTPQDNPYCNGEEVWDDGKQFPYDLLIQALAGLVNNCPDLKKIEVGLGSLTSEHEAASKKLADAIKDSNSLRMKKDVKLECWCAKHVPWKVLPEKEWDPDVDSEEEGDY